jgi:putative DNA primase/helicase
VADGRHGALVAQVRGEWEPRRRSEIKKGLPCVQFSAAEASEGRGTVRHSGLLQIDVDHIGIERAIELREQARRDPHVAAAFVSPSGDGLKLIIAIPADLGRHGESFAAAARYVREVHGHEADRACKDVARLCFLSHDPEAWCKEAVPLDVGEWMPETPPSPKSPSEEAAPPVTYTDNDAGRAARFCDRWRDEILYVPERSVWFTWEDRWQRDTAGGLKRRAIVLADELLAAVVAQPATSKEELKAKGEAIRTAQRWGNESVIRPMLSLAEAHPGIQARVAELDADPWKLGTPNAVIDLRTGEAFEHHPGDRVTVFTRAPFDPEATAPRWLRFIEEVFPDAEVRRWVWKAAGYSITGDMGEEVFFVPHNTGRNGKSKFVNAIAWTLGDYADTAGQALVACDDRGGDAKREKAAIVGVRFLRAPEAEGRQKLNARLVKDITGGDPLNAEAKFEHPFTFHPTCKLWWPVNERPTIHEIGPAIWERIRLIPFERYFEPHERDPELETKLRAEASGILNWLVQGCLLWLKEGLRDVPAKVRAAVEEYRRDEDSLADFIEENTRSEAAASIPHTELFRRYESWAVEEGIRCKMSRKALAKQLRAKGWRDDRTGAAKVVWQSVALV